MLALAPIGDLALADEAGGTVDVTVSLGVGAVTVAGLAPTVAANSTAAPGAGSVTVTGLAPSVSADASAASGLGGVTLAGLAASVAADVGVAPASGAVTVTGLAPSVAADAAVSPGSGAVSVDGLAPSVSATGPGSVGPVNAGAWPVPRAKGAWTLPRGAGAWPDANFSSDWVTTMKTTRPRALSAGDHTVRLMSGGIERTFIAHVPEGLSQGAGMVIVYHGGGGQASVIQSNIGLDALADSNKFLAIYPTAVGGNWTDGRASTASGPNDVLFTQDLIKWAGLALRVNPAKAFAAGISNGGALCHWIRYQSPTTLKGIATVGANIPSSYEPNITAAGPVMTFHGLNDPLMLYAGGVNAALGPESWASAPNTIDRYGIANGGTTGTYTNTLLPDLDTGDGCTVRKWDYTGVTFQTTHYRIIGGGHTWPGGSGSLGVGNKTNDINATALMVEMFHSYGLW